MNTKALKHKNALKHGFNFVQNANRKNRIKILKYSVLIQYVGTAQHEMNILYQ